MEALEKEAMRWTADPPSASDPGVKVEPTVPAGHCRITMPDGAVLYDGPAYEWATEE